MTWEATPDPKLVIAAGDCAADGGIFAGSYAIVGGVAAVVPVDAVIPGCPPTPARAAERSAGRDGPARGRRIPAMTRVFYALAALAGLGAGVLGLAGVRGHAWTLRLSAVVPLGGLELAMDPLAGVFVAIAGLTIAAASLYAIGYAGDRAQGRGAYLAFAAALLVVPLAANAMTFLIAWEVMSLASWALVLDGRDDRGARRAGWIYAVMTHAGFACLLSGMLLIATHTQSTRFTDWQTAAPALAPAVRSAAWALLAIGFAAKAGVIPLHVWLPLAHPAAPSHVSALMSGVMIKLGIYGLLRAGFEWLEPGPAWWGGALLVLGAVSAVVGILYALVEADLKRLLAFSSIENVGVILIGVGGALLFAHGGGPGLAALALVAALCHTVNHAAFKALLFLGAGAVAARDGHPQHGSVRAGSSSGCRGRRRAFSSARSPSARCRR